MEDLNICRELADAESRRDEWADLHCCSMDLHGLSHAQHWMVDGFLVDALRGKRVRWNWGNAFDFWRRIVKEVQERASAKRRYLRVVE